MIILGVDPGLKATGYGFLKRDANTVTLLEVGSIEPKSRDPLENKLQKIYSILRGLVKTYKPDAMVVEKLYSHHHHPATASIMGHARGVICLICAQENVVLKETSVKRIRKSLTGNGNASKAQTRRYVANVLHIDEAKLTLDASDALALALGYTHLSKLAV